MRRTQFWFESFGGRHASRVDLSQFINGVTSVINDVVDAAMDGVIEAIDAVPFTAEDVEEQLRGARDCFRGWRWSEWKDDDDPAEAMR